jgi:hypothetical protein
MENKASKPSMTAVLLLAVIFGPQRRGLSAGSLRQ